MLEPLDTGSWCGRPISEIDPAELKEWVEDPDYRKHGGESLSDYLIRVQRWARHIPPGEWGCVTEQVHGRAMAVLAFGAEASALWNIDFPPGWQLRLHGRDSKWIVRGLAPSSAHLLK